MADGNADLRDPVLPNNISAEVAVLGAVLFDNNDFPTAAERLGEGDFFDPAHRRIWKEAAGLIQAGRTANAVTLRETFEKDGVLREIGGARYLAELLDNAAFGPELKDYADIVRQCAVRRRMLEAAEYLADKAMKAGDMTSWQNGPALLAAAREIIDDVATAVSPDTWKDSRIETIEALAQAVSGNAKSAIPTGIHRLDDALGGLFREDLLIIAGRPSMGKSALCDQVETNVAKRDMPQGGKGVVAKFSLEMGATALGFRNVTRAAHMRHGVQIAYTALRRGALSDSDARMLASVAQDLPHVHWDTQRGIDIGHIRTQLRRLVKKYGRVDLVTCDYLQIMELNRGKNQNLSEAIGIVTSGLKAIAGEFNCAVICLSQLTKDVDRRDDKRPNLADLRDSGAIEADADAVMFCYREHYYLSREPEPKDKLKAEAREADLAQLENQMDVIIGKQRMGAICTVPLFWSAESSFIASTRSEITGEPGSRRGFDAYEQELPL